MFFNDGNLKIRLDISSKDIYYISFFLNFYFHNISKLHILGIKKSTTKFEVYYLKIYSLQYILKKIDSCCIS